VASIDKRPDSHTGADVGGRPPERGSRPGPSPPTDYFVRIAKDGTLKAMFAELAAADADVLD
jgi:hypothetical protein